MRNPYMEALAQGGSVANQGMAQASNTLNSVANIFNSSASLALKMNALLEQEEARKQQELLQTAQFMHNVQQDEFMNKMKEKRFELDRQRAESSINYQNTLSDTIKEKQNVLSSLQEKGIRLGSDGLYHSSDGSIYEPTAVEASLLNYKPPKQAQLKPSELTGINAINWVKNNNAIIDYKTGKVFNKNTGKEISQVPIDVLKYYELDKYKLTNKTGNTLGSLKDPTTLSNVLPEISKIYMSDMNPYEKIAKMNEVSTANGINLSTLALATKKTNPELYGYIVETTKDAYKQALLDGNTKIANELGSQLNAINPKALKEADNDIKVDYTVKTSLIPEIIENSKKSDNENLWGGSFFLTEKFSKEELTSMLKEKPYLALMVGLTNDINREATLFNFSRWFKTSKKATLSNMISKDLGLDPIDFDFLSKEGIISKKTIEEMRELANQYNNTYIDSMFNSSYSDSPIKDDTDILSAQPSLDTRTTVPTLNTIQDFSNKELRTDINKYNKSKQRLVQLFKKDKLDVAYKKVQDYLRQRYAHYITYGNLDPKTAYKNAKEETFKHFDKKTLGKALLFTYFMIKKEQNNINK